LTVTVCGLGVAVGAGVAVGVRDGAGVGVAVGGKRGAHPAVTSTNVKNTNAHVVRRMHIEDISLVSIIHYA
jgi:pantoate kinase